MRTEDKLDFDIYPKESGYWVDVTIKSHGHPRSPKSFTPSFEDLWHIVLLLSWCEVEKYKHFVKDPIDKVTAFFSLGSIAARQLIKKSSAGELSVEDVEKAWVRLSTQTELPPRTREPSLFSLTRHT